MKISVRYLGGKMTRLLNAYETNAKLISHYVRWQRFNRSQVRVPTKTRSEVNYSGRKLRPQKGSGRSRLGDRSSPMLRKGAVAHGPKKVLPRIGMNRRMRFQARLSLLHYLRDKLNFVNRIDIEGERSSDFRRWLLKRNLSDKRLLFIVNPEESSVLRSSRNFRNVRYSSFNHLNAVSMMGTELIIFSKDTLNLINSEVDNFKKKG